MSNGYPDWLTPSAPSRSRLGSTLIATFIAGLGLSLFTIVALALSWSWVIMLFVGSTMPTWGWGYWHTVFPYGITLAIILVALAGFLRATRSD